MKLEAEPVRGDLWISYQRRLGRPRVTADLFVRQVNLWRRKMSGNINHLKCGECWCCAQDYEKKFPECQAAHCQCCVGCVQAGAIRSRQVFYYDNNGAVFRRFWCVGCNQRILRRIIASQRARCSAVIRSGRLVDYRVLNSIAMVVNGEMFE